MPVISSEMPSAGKTIFNCSPRLRAVRTLRQWIAEGVLPAGERIPSTYDLAARLKIPRSTVHLALRELESAGLLRGDGRHRVVASKGNGQGRVMSGTLAILSDVSPQVVTGHRVGGWQEFIQLGVIHAAQAQGLHTLILQSELVNAEQVRRLIEDPPRGVVALRRAVESKRGREVLTALKSAEIPVVVYGAVEEAPEFDAVASDHEAGSYAVTRCLVQRGCRRILRYWQLHPTMTQRPAWLAKRDAGHERAMREAGLDVLPPVECLNLSLLPDTRESLDTYARYAVGHLYSHLTDPAPVDAILCISDGVVTHAAAACRLLGKRPNEDVALAGYDNYWTEAPGRQWESTAPLATVDKGNREIGRALVELLEARLAGRLPPDPQHRLVPPQLVLVGGAFPNAETALTAKE